MTLNKKMVLVLLAFFMFFSVAPSFAAGEIKVKMKIDGMV